MVTKVGIIGMSPENGHPYSFSAIVNGYDESQFVKAGWPGIHTYLNQRSNADFGFEGFRVTHAWTQDTSVTRTLCDACLIDTPCVELNEMLDGVDAVIIARDDWQSHFDIAMPFLKAGKSVYIDKPLTLDEKQLADFVPYLRNGQLMSCAGLRFAVEMDEMRNDGYQTLLGTPKMIVGTVLNDVEKYGIHIIEAVASLGSKYAEWHSISRLEHASQSFMIELGTGVPFILNCLGKVGKTFHCSLFGECQHQHFDLHDNFSAFRVTLREFFNMVETRTPPIDPEETIRLMKLIMTAVQLEPGQKVILNPERCQ